MQTLWTVLCLLHFVSLTVYIYLVTCRLARIVVLFEWLNFVNALWSCVSTCICHILHATVSHLIISVVCFTLDRLLDRVFAEELGRPGLILVLILNRNRGSLRWHELFVRLKHLILVALVRHATITLEINKTVTGCRDPFTWQVKMGPHARFGSNLLTVLQGRDRVQDGT